MKIRLVNCSKLCSATTLKWFASYSLFHFSTESVADIETFKNSKRTMVMKSAHFRFLSTVGDVWQNILERKPQTALTWILEWKWFLHNNFSFCRQKNNSAYSTNIKWASLTFKFLISNHPHLCKNTIHSCSQSFFSIQFCIFQPSQRQ